MRSVIHNRDFYNKVAANYNKADGRRSKPYPWLEERLWKLRRHGPKLLDVGAGAGFVSNIAADYFRQVWALDVSEAMLNQITNPGIKKVCYEGGMFPFERESFDAVVTFATLHHVGELNRMFNEISRVLKYGGEYYSDHDLSFDFYDRFKPAIELYRKIKNAPKRFGVTKVEYEQAEFWNKGISHVYIKELCYRYFDYFRISYHWQGILPISGEYGPGKAPMMRIYAKKGFKK